MTSHPPITDQELSELAGLKPLKQLPTEVEINFRSGMGRSVNEAEQWKRGFGIALNRYGKPAYARVADLESKLALAVNALEFYKSDGYDYNNVASQALAAIKGEKK